MKAFSKYMVLLVLLNTFYNYGQISPGDLTNAHAKFEGMSNCTLCHDLGNKVTNNKCLECHKDIQALIKQKKGYHISIEVKGKDCFQCHNEHHGRKFNMIHFDEKKFKHNLTGYKLEGKHAEVDCKKCHVSGFIADVNLKKRPQTFLGLDNKCASCHTDYHQKTLSSNDCAKCHDTKKFKPAVNFDHNKADFKLKGKHLAVDCTKCHAKSTLNGKDFQKFNNLSFNDCKSCHNNPHSDKIKATCTQCHNEASFKVIKGVGKFNHNTTNFTLKGSHLKVDCFSCHAKTTNPKLVFQDKLGIDETNCVKCHEDKHSGKLGNDCTKCHNEIKFVSSKTLESFDHKTTDYPLVGRHQKVDCKQCHKTEKYTQAIDFSACKNCHTDYHKGEFIKNGLTPDCKQCHSLNQGFDNTLFTTEQHQKSKFPLEGAHGATPCFACHVSEKEKLWTFKNLGITCSECHQDQHKDLIQTKFYPNKKCTACHNSETWNAINFDHKLTKFPLEGKHLETDCRSCHFKLDTKNKITVQKFINLDMKCSGCHTDNHKNQFALNGVTDCTRCHTSKNWLPEKFDHNTTNFKLDGRHAQVACNLCHKAVNESKNLVSNYKIEKHQCIDCHR